GGRGRGRPRAPAGRARRASARGRPGTAGCGRWCRSSWAFQGEVDGVPEGGPGAPEGVEGAGAVVGDRVVPPRRTRVGLLPARRDEAGLAQSCEQRVERALPAHEDAVGDEPTRDVEAVGLALAQRRQHAVLQRPAPQVREDAVLAGYHASRDSRNVVVTTRARAAAADRVGLFPKLQCIDVFSGARSSWNGRLSLSRV